MPPTFCRSHLANACLGSALLLLLAMAAPKAAQTPAQYPCALLTDDEIQTLNPQLHVSDGIASAVEGFESFTCRYRWGAGADRKTLAVGVNPASRMFAGLSADAIKQEFLSSVVPGTTDETIPDVGAAAVFRAYSPMYVGASAYVKDRILQVQLDGMDAREKKGQLVALLKAAASRM